MDVANMWPKLTPAFQNYMIELWNVAKAHARQARESTDASFNPVPMNFLKQQFNRADPSGQLGRTESYSSERGFGLEQLESSAAAPQDTAVHEVRASGSSPRGSQ